MIIIVRELGNSGKYEARLLDGRVLCSYTRQPFLDSARILLREGVSPQTALVMRREGSLDCLSSTVGHAAKLMVEEGRHAPFFRRWRPSAYGRSAAD